jgi:ABC-type molybdenum transport system ATPase subunit/photorepair protein PhrA
MTEVLITAGASQRPAGAVGAPDAVVAEGLTKRYGARAAVDDLSFAIPTGIVAGLIGPNGAGKTTLMAMLLGLVHPTSGTGTVLGEPLGKPAGYELTPDASSSRSALPIAHRLERGATCYSDQTCPAPRMADRAGTALAASTSANVNATMTA